MHLASDAYDVGVIIGRFQVPDLHDAHRKLIETVCNEHDKVIILLGLSPLKATAENPLDFEARKQMILASFPDVIVAYVKDVSDDPVWSKKVDELIDDLTIPAQSVVLYGGRDSFISHYHGTNPTRELEQDVFISGTEMRKAVARSSTRASSDFRAGMVLAASSRFPTVYACVDVAVFKDDNTKILLGRKQHEKGYRLIGGFADPRSETFEQDARREVHEETHIEISAPRYVGSFNVDDWRYRREVDCIRTMLFTAQHIYGAPKPDDDIVEARWFDVDSLQIDHQVVPNHRPLVKAAISSL